MNNEIIKWKITKENVGEFPFQYVLDCEDQSEGYCDFELGDNEETMKLFEKYDYLEMTSDGRLYGVKGNTSHDIIIDDCVPLTDEEKRQLDEVYTEVD